MNTQDIRDTEQHMQRALRLSRWSMLANLLLALGKLAAGLLASSAAMVSDAVHSAGDMGTTLAVIVSVRLSSRGADEDHPYGHERLEAIAAILMAVALALTGAGIGWSGLRSLLCPPEGGAAVPGLLAAAAALVSIVVKEAMYRVTIRTAREIDSPALRADAWHHRADALSSIGSLVGILLSRMGLPWGDPMAAILIAVMIIKAGYDTFVAAAEQLTDKACDQDTEKRLLAVIRAQQGVLRVDRLQTRRFASRIYVDVEIGAEGSMTLAQAHRIAETVHDAVEQSDPLVKHCMVHVNPVGEDDPFTPD